MELLWNSYEVAMVKSGIEIAVAATRMIAALVAGADMRLQAPRSYPASKRTGEIRKLPFRLDHRPRCGVHGSREGGQRYRVSGQDATGRLFRFVTTAELHEFRVQVHILLLVVGSQLLVVGQFLSILGVEGCLFSLFNRRSLVEMEGIAVVGHDLLQ